MRNWLFNNKPEWKIGHYQWTTGYYFGGARSKEFATLRNVPKLLFWGENIGHAKSVGFRL